MNLINKIIPQLLILCLGLCSCNFVNNAGQVTTSLPGVPSTGNSVAKTLTLTPTAASTLISDTPTRSLQPSKNPSSSPTVSPTALPTLPFQEAKQMLDDLMTTNGSYPLYTLWGIIPGQTTLDDAQTIFAKIRSPLSLQSKDDGLERYYAGIVYQEVVQFGVNFIIRDSIVRSISVGITIQQEEMDWSDAWPAYSTELLLAQLGTPSKVQFSLDYPHETGYPAGTAFYDMILYYDEYDLVIEYYSAMVTQYGNVVRICPAKDFFIYGDIWFGNDFEYPPHPGLDIENVSDLTIENFRDPILINAENACFDLDVKAFYP